MVIYKSFGDGIRRCAAPVRVYAAIVEIDYEGDELQRGDLTEKITVSSEDMDARDAGMENGIFAAGRTIRVTTEAVFEDGMVISEVFNVELYSEDCRF